MTVFVDIIILFILKLYLQIGQTTDASIYTSRSHKQTDLTFFFFLRVQRFFFSRSERKSDFLVHCGCDDIMGSKKSPCFMIQNVLLCGRHRFDLTAHTASSKTELISKLAQTCRHMITLNAVRITWLDQAQVTLTSKNTVISVKMISVLLYQVFIWTVLYSFKYQTQINL